MSYQVDPVTTGSTDTTAAWFADGFAENTTDMKFDPKLWERKMSNGYGSRKFLITLGAILSALGMVLSGSLSPQEGIQAIITVAGGYLLAEGAGDVAERFKK